MKILVVFLTQHISKAFKCYLDPKMGLPCPHPVNAGLTLRAQHDIIHASQVTSSLATNHVLFKDLCNHPECITYS